MNYWSLFSGVGGFDLGFDRSGMACTLQVENDKFCRTVLNRHWPNVPKMEDVRDAKRENGKSADVICGGFPCSDVSIAGNRAGLAGDESGLWFEFARIIEELKPRWVVIENVTGLLSSNQGADIQMIIDYLTQIGYIVDIDIKDSQEFGVAQRRRRVFLSCVRLDALLQKKTNLSKQISADLLAQILLNTWAAIPRASYRVPLLSDLEKPTERCVNLLRKTTGLLEITRERLVFKKYQNNLGVLLDQFGVGAKSWTFGSIEKNELPDHLLQAMDMCESLLRRRIKGNGNLNISTLLNSVLVDACKQESKSTTLTLIKQITDLRIFTFAVASLYIITLMLHYLDWQASCWNVAQSLLMLLQENINYARQASCELFTEAGLRDGWWDYLSTAPGVQDELERYSGNIRRQQVLFESKSGAWNPPPSRGTGQVTTALTRNGPGAGGGPDDNAAQGHQLVPIVVQIAAPLTNSPYADNEAQHGKLIPTVARTLNAGPPRYDNDSEMFVAYNWQSGGDARHQFSNTTTPTLSANQVPAVGVRRLTPTECERLQGFPDGWTAGQSDTQRYKQLGNAVTVSVAEWIGRRIMEADSA